MLTIFFFFGNTTRVKTLTLSVVVVVVGQ